MPESPNLHLAVRPLSLRQIAHHQIATDFPLTLRRGPKIRGEKKPKENET